MSNPAPTESLRLARQWGWATHDARIPGVARDLAWALIVLCRECEELPDEQAAQALSLAREIRRLVRLADELQPGLIQLREVMA